MSCHTPEVCYIDKGKYAGVLNKCSNASCVDCPPSCASKGCGHGYLKAEECVREVQFQKDLNSRRIHISEFSKPV